MRFEFEHQGGMLTAANQRSIDTMNLPLLSRSFHSAVRALLLGCLALGARAADNNGFESIFDGRTLEGWRGQDMSFWTVEDGAITGTISPQHDLA